MPFAEEAARSCAPPAADKSRSRTPCEDDADEADEPSPECPPASEASHERLWKPISLTSWWVQDSGTSHRKRCVRWSTSPLALASLGRLPQNLIKIVNACTHPSRNRL